MSQQLEFVINTLRHNKEYLYKKYPIKSLSLFGSITRNDFTEKSDVDILVDFHSPIGIEFVDLADELEMILHKKVDLVSKNGVKQRYMHYINEDLINV